MSKLFLIKLKRRKMGVKLKFEHEYCCVIVYIFLALHFAVFLIFRELFFFLITIIVLLF